MAAQCLMGVTRAGVVNGVAGALQGAGVLRLHCQVELVGEKRSELEAQSLQPHSKAKLE